MTDAKPTSLRDIAERVGVSVMTVQRAIGAPHLVAEKTRRRILQVMREAGYVPDRNAASLVSRSSGFVGLVVRSTASPSFAAEVDGVAQFTRATGRDLLLACAGHDADGEHDALRAMLGRRPAGIVLTFSPADDATRTLLGQADVPVVETWDDPADPIDMVAGFSNDEAARQVARYLARTGRRRPAYFGASTGPGQARWTGFAEEWARATDQQAVHVPLDAIGSGSIGPGGEDGFASGAALFDQLGELDQAVDCVFCASDAIAAGVVFEAQRRGVAVPDDLAVCGFGDMAIAASMIPALTTVSVPARDMGLRAGELIAARHAGRPGPRRALLSTRLIVRDSA